MPAVERPTKGIAGMLVLMFLMAVPHAILLSDGEPSRDTLTSIKGMVTDDVGSPIQNAVIRIVANDRSYFNYTFTNSTGSYLVNASFLGGAYIEAEKDGYLRFRKVGLSLTGGMELTIDVTLVDLPAETEVLSGHMTLIGNGPAVGARIRLHTEQGIGPGSFNYYDYEDVSDSSGNYGIGLFGADYDFEVTYNGLRVSEGSIIISEGGGPHTLDIGIPDIPESRTTLKGFVTNGSGPVQGAMVVVASQDMSVQNVTMTNGSGYFELVFFGGDHVFLTMAEDNDMLFTRFTVPQEGVLWYNITLKERAYTLSGTVLDPEGGPVRNATVAYVQSHVFPDQNTYVTEDDGRFDLFVSSSPGFLVVSGEDPFEGWDHDTYFRDMGSIGSDLESDVQLSDLDKFASWNSITFVGWERFDIEGSMTMPLNNTRYMRLFLDSFAGDGDLVLDEGEFSFFYDQMISEDPEMQNAPMGLNTIGNLTIDGLSYIRMEDSYRLGFEGILGPVMGTEELEVTIGANYTLEGTLPASFRHDIELNLSLDDDKETSTGTVNLPGDWRLVGQTVTVHSIEQKGDVLTIINGKDPNADDDIDHEVVGLTFYDDTFKATIELPDEIYEGDGIDVFVNITDHLPDPLYDISWDFGDGNSTATNGTHTDHIYGDNGTFLLSVHVGDLYDRTIDLSSPVTVLNKAPIVVLEVSGAQNMTAYEGDEVVVSVNASDVPEDEMTICWLLNGTYMEVVPYSNLTSSLSFYPSDDGNMTIGVKVEDEDGGATLSNVTVKVINRPPVLEVTVLKRNTDLKEGDEVVLLVTEKYDDSPDDDLFVIVDVIGPDWDVEEEEEDREYRLRFDEAGTYDVSVALWDDDGGSDVRHFDFTVAPNGTWDHDGDGIPMDWEVKYGLSDEDPDDASEDIDEDGYSNLEEYLKGSDPTDEKDPPEKKGKDRNWLGLLIVTAAAVLLMALMIIAITMIVIKNRKSQEQVEE